MKRIAFLAAILIPVSAFAVEQRSASSSSMSSSSVTDANGNTVTTVKTVRDGKQETRRTVKSPDGTVLSDTTEGGAAGESAKPDQSPKEGGPWLGIHTGEVQPALRDQLDLRENEGLLVEQLAADSPAARAGLQKNDIVLSYNLTPVNSAEQLREQLAKGRPGEKAIIELLRKGQKSKVAVTLGKRAGSVSEQTATPPAGNAGKTGGGATSKSSSRTVIVGKDGKTQIIDNQPGGDPFAEMLKDPNIPEAMKESLRKMQEQMRGFEKQVDPIPGRERRKTAGSKVDRRARFD